MSICSDISMNISVVQEIVYLLVKTFNEINLINDFLADSPEIIKIIEKMDIIH